MANTYKIKVSDVGNGLVEGKEITPYYEDANEIIIAWTKPSTDHHVKKNGEYFQTHFEKVVK
jgi:hypothetical protein